MPYSLNWLHEPSVLHGRVWGELTLADIRRADAEMTQLLERATGPVHLVVDVSELNEYPKSVTSLYQAAQYFRHPNFGWEILYGMRNPVLEIILGVLAKLTPLHYGIAGSLSEALSALAQHDVRVAEILDHLGSDHANG